MSYRYDLENIVFKYEELLRNNSILTGLYKSTENMCAILSAILKTKDDNWVDHIQEFTLDEKQKYTKIVRPFIPSILSFFGGMKGGNEPGTPGTLGVPSINSSKTMMGDLVTSDELVEKVVGALDGINKTVYGIAKSSGLVKMQTQADEDKRSDIHPLAPIAPAVAALLTPVIPPGSQATIVEKLSGVTVPQRLLVILIYLFLV